MTLISNLRIVNVIATTELKQPVDLNRLVFAEGFLYDTAIYKCAYLKDDETRAKVSIFSTGKMISVGAKSFGDAKHDLLYAAKRLNELHLTKPTKLAVKLQNIVATGDVGKSVDLERLTAKLPKIIYEPEQFPGAIYYPKELEGASILIFANGKTVIAGLKSQQMLNIANRVLVKLVQAI